VELAGKTRCALMCAESVPWRCHRSMVADALLVRGIPVEHIINPGKRARKFALTPFAKPGWMERGTPDNRFVLSARLRIRHRRRRRIASQHLSGPLTMFDYQEGMSLILRLAAFVGAVFGIALMFAPDALIATYGADSLNNPGRGMAMLYGSVLAGFAIMNFAASRAPDVAGSTMS
jgi:hypothetical protein